MNRDTVDASKSSVELNYTDIPGAHLDEPLEAHNVAALRWWLLCRGIKVTTSLRKRQIIDVIVFQSQSLQPMQSLRFFLRKAMHGYAGVLFSSIGAHNADITWHTGPSVARKLRGLQPWLWHREMHETLQYFWKAIYWDLRLLERL